MVGGMKRTAGSMAAVALLLAACGREPPAEPAADIVAGRELAEAHCARCHGLDGRAERSDIPNLAAQPTGYLIESFHAYTEGRRHHAGLEDMATGISDTELRNIAAYYSALPPLAPVEPAAPAQEAASFYDEGGKIAAICEECHGPDGYSTEPGVPSLAAQQPAYLIAATRDYLKGNRGHVGRKSMLEGLQQVDIEKMAMYFASQVPPQRAAPPFGDPGRGRALSEDCATCHGSQGVSHDPLIPTLAGQEPSYLVAAIKAYRDDQRHHEDMAIDLSDAEIEDLAAYYAVQRPEAAADETAEIRDLAAKCERCHGPAVGERTLVVPSLDGQNREYLINVMKAYRDNNRGSSMMHKMSADYSDETIEAIASYYANRTPED